MKATNNNKTYCLLAVHLFLPLVLAAQDRRELRVIDTVPILQERAGPIMSPLKCGDDGSIYLRVVVNKENLMANPVVRISQDGKRSIRFTLDATSGLQKAGILDFAPGAHGDLYLLTTGPGGATDEFYVLIFDDSGVFVSKTKLQSGLSANQLAVFSSGELLISGRERGEEPRGPVYGKALTGIFDFHGQLIGKVELPSDIQLKTQAGPDEARRAAAEAERDYGRSISLSTAERARDGRIYLARYAAETPVFDIGAGGDVTPLRITIPSETYLGSVKVDGRKMATMFIKKSDPRKAQIAEVIFAVWDMNTGEKIEEFYGSALFGVAWACYKAGVLTFVNTGEDRHLQLVHASPN